jgi:hypothetical protein
MASHLEHDLDNTREHLKIFLNEEGKKGFGTDIFLCFSREAVPFFEDLLKEELQNPGKVMRRYSSLQRLLKRRQQIM